LCQNLVGQNAQAYGPIFTVPIIGFWMSGSDEQFHCWAAVVSYLQAQDGINSDLARQSWSRGAYFRVQHLPLDPENFLSRRSHEDWRGGLDGQRTQAAALAIRTKARANQWWNHPIRAQNSCELGHTGKRELTIRIEVREHFSGPRRPIGRSTQMTRANRLELERKLEQARRLAMEPTDPLTRERLAQLIEELEFQLHDPRKVA
jgi:hypothetical protein